MSVTWSVVSQIGFWGWVLATVGFIFRAMPARDTFRGRAAVCWGGGVVVFYVVWVIGMLNA
jgi:hypothetical protein